jgi:DNA-binding transcriptional ArsR family regulator
LTLPDHLPDEFVELIADRFAVLAEPMRIRILNHVRVHGQTSVGDLAQALAANQQNVSKHVGVLATAGLVTRSKDGTRTIVAIADPAVFDLCEQVCGGLQRRHAHLAHLMQGAA